MVRCEYGRLSSQQSSVSLTRPGLFMKPTKTLPAANQGHWALRGPIRYSTSSRRALRPHEMLRAGLFKGRGAFSCISPPREARLLFLSSRRLGSTDSLVSMLSQSAQSAHSFSTATDTALHKTHLHYTPQWKHFLDCL